LLFGGLAYHGTKHGVRSTPATHEPGLVTGDSCIEGDIERWAEEMDERLRHAVMSVSIEGVGEVSGRRDDSGSIRRY
jgi:hypothetical protein